MKIQDETKRAHFKHLPGEEEFEHEVLIVERYTFGNEQTTQKQKTDYVDDACAYWGLRVLTVNFIEGWILVAATEQEHRTYRNMLLDQEED